MNLWNAWRSMLGLASLCLAIIGCGGGGIPDPDADSNAAAEPPASSGPAAPAPAPGPAAPAPAVAATEAPAAPAPAEAATPVAAPTVEPVAAASAPAEMPAATATATPEAETPATAADPGRAKNASATAEMLALGNKPLPEETPAASTAPNGSPAPGAPGAMANNMIAGPIPPPGTPGVATSGMAPGGMPPGGMPPGGMISPGIPAENAGAGNGEIPGYPGGASGTNPAASNEAANFRSPASAVEAFLKALKAKNAERLAEATARRASTEASGPKNQKLFTSILEMSLTEDDLNDLANKMEGFQIVGYNVPKSSGKFSLILGKAGKNGESYRRTVTARHEKDGWKVLDISGVGTIERPIMGGRMRRR